MASTTKTKLTKDQLRDAIGTVVHPSNYQLGYAGTGILEGRKGVLEWHESRYTRLEMPASSSGFGTRWIDYDSSSDAFDAAARAKQLVDDAASVDDAYASLVQFYQGE